MPVRAPAYLCPSTNDVCEDVGCWPRVRVVDKGIHLFFCCIVDTESFFQQGLSDVGFDIVSRVRGFASKVVPELVG